MPPRQQVRDPRTHLGAFLGDQLRAIRVEAGYASQDDFAPVIRRDRSVIGKAETGESPPAEAVLGDWLEACGVGGRLRVMVEGVNRIARARDNPGHAQAEPFYEAEARAHGPLLGPDHLAGHRADPRLRDRAVQGYLYSSRGVSDVS